MAKDEWSTQAANLLKAELTRNGVTYEALVGKLKAIGVEETHSAIVSKINRGMFSFVFFMQCMKALGIKTVRFGE